MSILSPSPHKWSKCLASTAVDHLFVICALPKNPKFAALKEFATSSIMQRNSGVIRKFVEMQIPELHHRESYSMVSWVGPRKLYF